MLVSALTLALFPVVSASAQDGGGRRPGAGGGQGGPPPLPRPGENPVPVPAPAPTPTPEEGETPATDAAKAEEIDVRGNRFKVKLKRGSVVHGVLPRGVYWERLDMLGDYVEAKKGDTGAGVRIQFVLGMEGDIFIQEKDIAEIEDLGALTEEERDRIRDRILSDRRRAIEARERSLREDLDRIRDMAAAGKAEDAAAEKAASEKAESGEPVLTDEEAFGEQLLSRFSPETWGAKRKTEINQNQVNGIFPDHEEVEFLRNFSAWEKAYERRLRLEREKVEKEAKEAARKELEEKGEGTGEGEKEGEGEEKK
jgi:hypothetical protein